MTVKLPASSSSPQTRENSPGQFLLGSFYANSRGGLPKDDHEAARLFKLAADQGNGSAQNNLALFYEQGRGGLPQDDSEAARLYKLAAVQGNSEAAAALQRLGR
jgi:TPR repeat protein